MKQPFTWCLADDELFVRLERSVLRVVCGLGGGDVSSLIKLLLKHGRLALATRIAAHTLPVCVRWLVLCLHGSLLML